MSAFEILNLQDQLKNYGLNPCDWKLVPVSNRWVRIKNIMDEDFVFLGQVDGRAATRWRSLRLVSL